MTSKLKGLIIESVDLCKKGANPDAKIVLFKRDEKSKSKKGDDDMPKLQDVLEKLTDEEKGVVEAAAKATKDQIEKAEKFEKAEKDLGEMKTAKKAVDADVVSLKKKLEDVGKKEEGEGDILKDVDPKVKEYVEGLKQKTAEADKKVAEAATKTAESIKKSDDRIEKLETDIQKVEFIKKASELEGLAIKSEEFGETLMNIAKVAPDEVEKVMEVLRSASKVAAENAAIVKAIGADGEGEPGDAEQSMEKKAQAIAKSEKIPYEQAYVKACEDNGELYEKIKKGE